MAVSLNTHGVTMINYIVHLPTTTGRRSASIITGRHLQGTAVEVSSSEIFVRGVAVCRRAVAHALLVWSSAGGVVFGGGCLWKQQERCMGGVGLEQL